MDYKERYEQALRRAKKLLEDMDKKDYFASNGDIENIFPELKEKHEELEDERIRKGLIKAVSRIFEGNKLFDTDVTREEALAWIEKQGENKPTDKVEPKFHEGDFIVNDYCSGKIIEITNDAYLLDTGQGIPFSCEHNAHLWSIQDAKEGDVLVSDEVIFIFNNIHGVWVNCHCSLHKDGSFCEKNYDLMHIKYAETIYPATKEQRELLFEKINEAGYEWDSEKKELKKIEPKKLDADKVIEWLNENVANFWASPCNPQNIINQFKKDFGL